MIKDIDVFGKVMFFSFFVGGEGGSFVNNFDSSE